MVFGDVDAVLDQTDPAPLVKLARECDGFYFQIKLRWNYLYERYSQIDLTHDNLVMGNVLRTIMVVCNGMGLNSYQSPKQRCSDAVRDFAHFRSSVSTFGLK